MTQHRFVATGKNVFEVCMNCGALCNGSQSPVCDPETAQSRLGDRPNDPAPAGLGRLTSARIDALRKRWGVSLAWLADRRHDPKHAATVAINDLIAEVDYQRAAIPAPASELAQELHALGNENVQAHEIAQWVEHRYRDLLRALKAEGERDERQLIVFTWGSEAFGTDQMHSPAQRGLRMAEEAIELAQACQVDREQLHRLVDYVYGRPVGTVQGELGGVGVCLLALAQCFGVSADEMERNEVERVLSKPREHFTKRNAEKNEAGFHARAALGDTNAKA